MALDPSPYPLTAVSVPGESPAHVALTLWNLMEARTSQRPDARYILNRETRAHLRLAVQALCKQATERTTVRIYAVPGPTFQLVGLHTTFAARVGAGMDLGPRTLYVGDLAPGETRPVNAFGTVVLVHRPQ